MDPVKLGKRLARIPQTLRRVFLKQARGESDRFRSRFEERIELAHRDRALFDRTKIKRIVFANAAVPFALTSLSSSPFVQLLNATIERANLFSATKLGAGRRGPVPLVTRGNNEVRPFLVLRLGDVVQLDASIWTVARRRSSRHCSRGRFAEPA